MPHTIPSPTSPGRSDGSLAPSRSVQRVIAVAGPRPGSGATTIAVNLGVYLAQLGRRVILVDCDASGAGLHSALSIPSSEVARIQKLGNEEQAIPLLPSPVPGLSIAPQLIDLPTGTPLRPGRRARWIKDLRDLPADYVILDLGAGTQPSTLDAFSAADLGVIVCQPEPSSIEFCYRLQSRLLQRRLKRGRMRDRFQSKIIERIMNELPAEASPLAIQRALAASDINLGNWALEELTRIQPRLIMNGARSRLDSDAGLAVADMSLRYLGVRVDFAGAVEQEDNVWLSSVRGKPLLIDSPTSRSAKNIERLARRILALLNTRSSESSAVIQVVPTLYDLLMIHRGANDEEIRRAYRRMKQVYQPGSLALVSLLDEGKIDEEIAKVDEAHDTLMDPVKRRAYDISTFPETVEPSPPPVELSSAQEAERAMLRDELLRELKPESEFGGELLEKVRISQGIEMETITNLTKISKHYLVAIESEDFTQLPAYVYLRGFLQQYAKALKLDPSQVSRTYLRRYRNWKNGNSAENLRKP